MMKMLRIAASLAAVLAFVGPLHAATPDQEKAFVDAYKKAFDAKDGDALKALLYTEGADPMALEFYGQMMTAEFGGTITEISLVDLTADDVKQAAAGHAGSGGRQFHAGAEALQEARHQGRDQGFERLVVVVERGVRRRQGRQDRHLDAGSRKIADLRYARTPRRKPGAGRSLRISRRKRKSAAGRPRRNGSTGDGRRPAINDFTRGLSVVWNHQRVRYAEGRLRQSNGGWRVTIAIKALTEEDVEFAAHIISRAYAPPPWNEDWSFEAAAERVTQLLAAPKRVALAAFDAERLRGIAIGTQQRHHAGQVLYLEELSVLPKAQRSGIGTALLFAVVEAARLQGCYRVWLASQHTGKVFEFYRRNGFLSSDKLRIYYKSA